MKTCDIPPPGEKYIPPTFQEAIIESEVIVTGKALRNIPDRSFDFGDELVKAFTSEIEVSCIFKGSMPILPVMNISENGAIPGMCIETKVEIGKEYIFAMTEHDGTFRLWHDTVDKNEGNMEILTKQCGLFSMAPIGASESPDKCPPVANPDTCEPYTPPPPPPGVDTDIQPPTEKKMPDDDGPMAGDIPKADGEGKEIKAQEVSGQEESGAESLRSTFISILVTICLAVLAH